jgi:Zn-dependent protease
MWCNNGFPSSHRALTLRSTPVFDLTLHQLIIRLGACLVIVAVHGFALAGIAWLMGDRGPRLDGRLTLNPFTHLDMIGALVLILFQLGWIKPMAIDPAALRLGRLGLVVCVIGSLAVTLAVAVILLALRTPALIYLPIAVSPTVIAILNGLVEMGAWFAAFNLLPIPPLTGEQFLVAVRPSLAAPLARYQLHAAIVVAVLIFLGAATPVIKPLRDALASVLPVL